MTGNKNNLMAGLTLAAGLLLPLTVGALEVHKWTDAQGVVHYSESPPDSSDIASVEMFEVQSEYEAPAESSREKYRSLLEVAKELEKSRLAREEARAEREARAREQWQQVMAPPAYAGVTAGYPVGFAYSQGYYHNRFGYPFGHFQGFGGFSQSDRFGPILNRGQFVPNVQFRPFQNYNPAARAQAIGGEARSLQ